MEWFGFRLMDGANLIFGLSFERPYLIKGLNLTIPTFAEAADFGKTQTADFENHGLPK